MKKIKGDAEKCRIRRAAELLIVGNDKNQRKLNFFKIKVSRLVIF